MVPESMVDMATCSYTTGNQGNIITMTTKSDVKEESDTDDMVETTTQEGNNIMSWFLKLIRI